MSFTDDPFPSGWEIATNNYLVSSESSSEDVFGSLDLDLDKVDPTTQVLVHLQPAFASNLATETSTGFRTQPQQVVESMRPVITFPCLNNNNNLTAFARQQDLKLLNSAVLLQRRPLLPSNGQQVVIHQAGFSSDSFTEQQLQSADTYENDLTPLLNAAATTFSADVQASGGKFAIMLTEPWPSNLCLASNLVTINPITNQSGHLELNSSEFFWSPTLSGSNASTTSFTTTATPQFSTSMEPSSTSHEELESSKTSSQSDYLSNDNEACTTTSISTINSQDQMSPDDSGLSTADSFAASVASSFSQGSPYSSLSSPCPSHQSFFESSPINRVFSTTSGSKSSKNDSTLEPTPEFDPELERIVDDVDSMYREHLRLLHPTPTDIKSELIDSLTRSFNGIENGEDLVLRNLPSEKLLTFSGYDLTARNIAEKIAKKMVERALEKDRRRLVRKIQRRSQPINQDLDDESHVIADNYVDVAVGRVLDDLIEELISNVTSDVSNSVKYNCNGNAGLLSSVEVEGTVDMLQREMDAFVTDFTESEVQSTFGGLFRSKECQLTDEDYLINSESAEFEEFLGGEARWRCSKHVCSRSCDETIKRQRKQKNFRPPRKKCPAVAKKDIERSRRNSFGILVSSLRKKVYHCRCIDCQAKRRNEGKPEPDEPIEIKEINFRDDDISAEMIPVPQKKGRGRPRKYLRLEDVIEWRQQKQVEDPRTKISETSEKHVERSKESDAIEDNVTEALKQQEQQQQQQNVIDINFDKTKCKKQFRSEDNLTLTQSLHSVVENDNKKRKRKNANTLKSLGDNFHSSQHLQQPRKSVIKLDISRQNQIFAETLVTEKTAAKVSLGEIKFQNLFSPSKSVREDENCNKLRTLSRNNDDNNFSQSLEMFPAQISNFSFEPCSMIDNEVDSPAAAVVAKSPIQFPPDVEDNLFQRETEMDLFDNGEELFENEKEICCEKSVLIFRETAKANVLPIDNGIEMAEQNGLNSSSLLHFEGQSELVDEEKKQQQVGREKGKKKNQFENGKEIKNIDQCRCLVLPTSCNNPIPISIDGKNKINDPCHSTVRCCVCVSCVKKQQLSIKFIDEMQTKSQTKEQTNRRTDRQINGHLGTDASEKELASSNRNSTSHIFGKSLMTTDEEFSMPTAINSIQFQEKRRRKSKICSSGLTSLTMPEATNIFTKSCLEVNSPSLNCISMVAKSCESGESHLSASSHNFLVDGDIKLQPSNKIEAEIGEGRLFNDLNQLTELTQQQQQQQHHHSHQQHQKRQQQEQEEQPPKHQHYPHQQQHKQQQQVQQQHQMFGHSLEPNNKSTQVKIEKNSQNKTSANSNFNLEEKTEKTSKVNLSRIKGGQVTYSMELYKNGSHVDLLLPKKEESEDSDYADGGYYKCLIQDELEVVKEEKWSDEEIEIVGEKFVPRYIFPRPSFFVQRTFPCCYSRIPTCPNVIPCMCCSTVPPVKPQYPGVRLKKCFVRMEDAKAVCDAFIAATSQYSHRSRNRPNFCGKRKKFRAAGDEKKTVANKKQIA